MLKRLSYGCKWISSWAASCYRYVQKRKNLKLFLVLAFLFLVFFLVYFSVSTLSSADDHMFHFQFAEQIRLHGFISSFQDMKAIYFSGIAQGDQYFAYYNFLFYLVLIPFTYITPLYLGIKLYAVFAVAIAFAMLYWCLDEIEIRMPFTWTLVIIAISSTDSIWRFFLSRPYALSPALLLVLLVFLYKKKYWLAAILSFLYLYWHGATFFLPLCIAIAYFVIEKFYGKKGDYKNLLAVFGGTALAVASTYIVSSGFLQYIAVNYGSFTDTIIGKKVNIGEGNEEYPSNIIYLIKDNSFIFITFVSALAIDIAAYIGYKRKSIDSQEYFIDYGTERRILHLSILILTALFFLGTVAVSGRFGDYFTFFAGIYIALSFDYLFKTVSFSASRTFKRGIAAGLIIALIYVFGTSMLFLQEKLAYGSRPDEFYQVGTWLKNNTDPHDIIFIDNWGWFTSLYYFSPDDYYTMGIEPRFLYTYSHQLYWLSIHISQDGFVCDTEKCPDLKAQEIQAFRSDSTADKWATDEGDQIASVLLGQFHSSYIVTSDDYQELDFIMNHNTHFQKEMYDSIFHYSIYKVKSDVNK